MPRLPHPAFVRLLLVALLTSIAAPDLAQTPATSGIDPKSLRRPLPTYSQADREFGFAHFDQIYKTHLVKRGDHVHPLPEGLPLPGFNAGGAGAKVLQKYMDDYKLSGVVVLQDGKVRLERYAPFYSAAGKWVSFSMSKSLTSTLVGAAIRDGYIGSVDDQVVKYIPEMKGSAYDGVTIRQVLTMTSGVKWNEDYVDPKADVALFYTTPPDPGVDATVSYMRKLPRESAPGSQWVYKTGETNLIGVVVQQATKKDLATYASEKIWAPYGMEQDAPWMLDATDHVQGGCCLNATVRDYARLGQFILDGARIDGKPVVANGYLEAATHKQADFGRPGRGYGYQWWTIDDGSFDALGIYGQMIHIDPNRHLVIAMNAAWSVATGQKESLARAALVSAIVAAADADAKNSTAK